MFSELEFYGILEAYINNLSTKIHTKKILSEDDKVRRAKHWNPYKNVNDNAAWIPF